MQSCCQVLELRQYTLHPGKRDTLIDLFEKEFVESQEALGMKLVGQFRDARDPNRFVWLRGFADMPSRASALQAFYSGPAWKRHRESANATMVDSDNVLLLRPARPESGFDLAGMTRAPIGAAKITGKPIFATIQYFDARISPEFIDRFERSIVPASTKAGARLLAYFVTETATNDYPALPVREGENVFVCFATSEMVSVDTVPAPRDREVLQLDPTPGSLLRG
jgi:hypothetical protein